MNAQWYDWVSIGVLAAVVVATQIYEWWYFRD